MFTARARWRAYTLIEVLIVVMIVGIIAVMVIPRFTSATQQSQEATIKTTLRYLREQIELFKTQHGDAPPQNGALWWLMQTSSSPFETATAAPVGTGCGPYFHMDPVNPWNNQSRANSAAIDPAAGWYYSADPHTYELRARNKDGTVNFDY